MSEHDRAHDIGTKINSDAAAIKPPSLNINRSPLNYGTKNENVEEFVPADVATAEEDTNTLTNLVFQAQFDNTLTAKHPLDEDTTIYIAKPPQLRKSSFDTDGEENDAGEIVTYTGPGTRTREFESNGTVVTVEETIYPPYASEDLIFVAEVDDTGEAAITLLDTNVDARRWEDRRPTTKYFAIELLHRDTLQCVEWDFATKAPKLDSEGVVLPSVEVAKAYSLRGTVWSSVHNGGSENPDGVDYTTDGNGDDDDDGHKDRFADDDNDTEDQEVLPPWFNTGDGVWVTIIRAVRMDAGTGAIYNDVQSIWQDTNDDGRAFTQKFA